VAPLRRSLTYWENLGSHNWPDHIIYKVLNGRGGKVPSIPWLTEAAAREQIAVAEEDDASDNSVTLA
jgi:hypothetical protein